MPRKIRQIPWLDTRDGVYYVFWYDKETKRTARRSLQTGDPEEAQAAYVMFLTEGRAMYQKAGPDLSVAAACDFYEKNHVDHNCADAARQRTALKRIRDHFGQSPIRLVDSASCRDYGAARAKIGTKPVTVARELSALKAAAMHCRENKMITLAEMPLIKMPKFTYKPVGFYTKSELRHILARASDIELQRYMTLLYYTGSRRRVIEKMEIDQVDFNTKTIRQAKVGERSTKKRRPPIRLYAEIEQVLKDLIDDAMAKGTTFLFGRDLFVPYRRHLEGLGFVGRAHPHMMRHTRATLMLLDGTPIHKVAVALGDTVATIEKTYAHVTSKDLEDVGGAL